MYFMSELQSLALKKYSKQVNYEILNFKSESKESIYEGWKVRLLTGNIKR